MEVDTLAAGTRTLGEDKHLLVDFFNLRSWNTRLICFRHLSMSRDLASWFRIKQYGSMISCCNSPVVEYASYRLSSPKLLFEILQRSFGKEEKGDW